MTDNPSPESLIQRFRHLDRQQKQEFIRLLQSEMQKGDFDMPAGEWEELGLAKLQEEWEQPENDFWDEEFAKQSKK